jgi:hypothetical protein
MSAPLNNLSFRRKNKTTKEKKSLLKELKQMIG